MSSIALCLDWPPSVNHAWNPTFSHGKTLTAEYRRFIKSVGDDVLLNRVKRHWTTKPLVVCINCRPPNARSFDIDNRVKTLLDAIVRAGVIVDDKHVEVLVVHRGTLDAPLGSVDVTIAEIDSDEDRYVLPGAWLSAVVRDYKPTARLPSVENQQRRIACGKKRLHQRRLFTSLLE